MSTSKDQPPFEGFELLTQENWPAGLECFGWIKRGKKSEWERCILRFTYAQLSFIVGHSDTTSMSSWHTRTRDELNCGYTYMFEAPK